MLTKYFAKFVIIGSLTLSGFNVLADAAGLDKMLADRNSYLSTIVLLTQISNGEAIENNNINQDSIAMIRKLPRPLLAANGVITYKNDDVFSAPCVADASKLCYSDALKAKAKAYIPEYVNSAITADHIYRTAVSIINKDQLSQKHIAEIQARIDRAPVVQKQISELYAKILKDSLQSPGVVVTILGLVLLTIVLIAAGGMAALSLAAAKQILVTIWASLAVASATGTLGYVASKISKSPEVAKLFKQVDALEKEQQKLGRELITDQEILKIVNKDFSDLSTKTLP